MRFRDIFPGYRWVRFMWAVSMLFPLFLMAIRGAIETIWDMGGPDEDFPMVSLLWFLFCWIVFAVVAWVAWGFKRR